jgi:hypothetical protein
MKVKCLAASGKALFPRTLQIHNLESRFSPLEPGEIYTVYGIYLWKGNLHYLVVPRYKGVDQNPFYDPAELFEVIDSHIPDDWYYTWLGNSEADEAIWGYRELALDYPNHNDKLMDRDPEALRLFKERMIEMNQSLDTK